MSTTELRDDIGEDEKETAIIEAARKTFLARGFDSASMDAIALSAGVSKRTVYNRFRSKEELFAAAINESCKRLMPKDVDEIEAHLPPRDFIRQMSSIIVHGIFSDESIALRRIATFEAGRNPALGKLFLEAGPRWLVRNCAPLLERLMARGEIRKGDAEEAIWQLGFLITEPLHTEILLGDPPADIETAIGDRIDRGVDAFLRIYAK
ncbi:MAG: TetR/AcrR family transcriptional regulator [Parvularculaceae bacterium]